MDHRTPAVEVQVGVLVAWEEAVGVLHDDGPRDRGRRGIRGAAVAVREDVAPCLLDPELHVLGVAGRRERDRVDGRVACVRRLPQQELLRLLGPSGAHVVTIRAELQLVHGIPQAVIRQQGHLQTVVPARGLVVACQVGAQVAEHHAGGLLLRGAFFGVDVEDVVGAQRVGLRNRHLVKVEDLRPRGQQATGHEQHHGHGHG
mmetsp:Transcript_11573/g.35771  ORF Transcript_11573/g.35771 Transcript_11573/m.35771 type:complete len:202 (-) Transcript_11573:107-712(-)